MGQVSSIPSLASLSIAAIQSRIKAARPLREAAPEPRNRWGAPAGSSSMMGAITPAPIFPRNQGIGLSDAEVSVILAIAENPSSDDLDDVARIDGFFGSYTRDFCDRAKKAGGNYAALLGAFGGIQNPNAELDAEIEQALSNPFFCTTPETFPNILIGGYRDYGGFFGIDTNQPWGAGKVQVQNAITVMNVISAYPFPPPIDVYPAAFWLEMLSEIQEIVHTPYPVDPEAVRYYVTMAVLANYTDISNKIEAGLKKKAKNAKRKALMTTIGLVLASIVAAFLLPMVIVAIASAIKTAVTTYIDAQKRRDAARQMANASKMFEADAPAFSREVDHAAAVLDEQAAKAQANMPPDPALQAAIQEVESNSGPAWGTILPVGGGIAAAGLAAFAIFR